MSISREAQIGQSMIFAFPPWFRNTLMSLLLDGRRFEEVIGAFEFSSSMWTKILEGTKRDVWIHSDFATSDECAILRASWCRTNKLVNPNTQYNDLGRAPDYWKSDWVMPHLASLDGKQSPDIILNFGYDQTDHVYSLKGVCALGLDEDGIRVATVPPIMLMTVWLKEFLREEETARAGSEEFLDALKLLQRSTDKRTERLRRYANALLQWYNMPPERGANPKS